jgi:hypothetical protein
LLSYKQPFLKPTIICIFCLIILLLSNNVGFFWDNVLLSSKMGHYLYNNGLLNINFPIEFDPGHPPLMTFLQAAGWMLLGKKLLVSHLVSMPFLFGFVWQLHNFVCHFTSNKKHQLLAVAFVFL